MSNNLNVAMEQEPIPTEIHIIPEWSQRVPGRARPEAEYIPILL